MKKLSSELLALLAVVSLAINSVVPIMAEEMTEEPTHEAVVFEDDFTGEAMWSNYNTNNNDKRILTINSKKYEIETGEYSGTEYLNQAYIETLNIAPFENRMEKRFTDEGSFIYNAYSIPNKLGDNFKIETTYRIYHFLQRTTPAEGEFSVRTVVSNDHYALEYSIEKDGIWVLNSTGVWEKKQTVEDASGEWNAVVSVTGNQADIIFTHNNTEYTVTYELPTIETAGEIMRQFYYGTKVLDQTKDEDGTVTYQNYASYSITYSKAINIYDNYVLVDDMQSEKSFGKYINMSVQELDNVQYSQTKRLLLTDKSQPGEVIYTVPDDGKIVDFNIVKAQNVDYQSTVSFYLISNNGQEIEIQNNPSEISNAAIYENRDYCNGGFMYYYEPNDALKILLENGNYLGIKVKIWVDRGVSPDGKFPSLIYTDIEYKKNEDALDQENQPEIPQYKGDVILKDDFLGDNINWYQFRLGIINIFNDAIIKNDDNVFFSDLNTPSIDPYLSTSNGSDDKYVLNTNIGSNYAFEMTYRHSSLYNEGDPQKTGNLSAFAQVRNGKNLLHFTSERNGIWAYTSNEQWENVLPLDIKTGIDYTVKALVENETATLYLCYTTPYGKSRVYKSQTYTLPSNTGMDVVNMGIVYKVSCNNAAFNLFNMSLTNIVKEEFVVDDCSTDNGWVTYDDNVERTVIEGNLYRSTHQYDLKDPTKDGSVYYTVDGYIRDFSITRRLGASNQGSLYLRIYDKNGILTYLALNQDFIAEVGGYYNDGHLYYYIPTDSLKEKLAVGEYTKLEVVLAAETSSSVPANDIYPAIVRAFVEYDKFDDLVIGEHIWQTNKFTGDVAFAVDFTKNTSGTLRILPVLAAYDENGYITDVYISEVQEFEKGDNRAMTIGPVFDDSTVKAFLWNADTMTPLCEAFIKQ